MIDRHPHLKDAVDVVSAGVAGGVLLELLPAIVSVLAIIWYVIRIGEWAYGKYKARKSTPSEE